MHDIDVRNALLESLSEIYRNDAGTRVVEEMGIWSGTVRIDVAVINGRLHGYELKSAKDTLERLDYQAELYNGVFDCVTLVTAENHYHKASKKIPRWWGIQIAVSTSGGKVRLRNSRQPKANPSIDPAQVARLLWRPELLELLERHAIDRGVRSATIDVMASRAAEQLPLDVLRGEVRETLKRREGWLGQPVQNQRQVTV